MLITIDVILSLSLIFIYNFSVSTKVGMSLDNFSTTLSLGNILKNYLWIIFSLR
jgi:hypothetical protein